MQKTDAASPERLMMRTTKAHQVLAEALQQNRALLRAIELLVLLLSTVCKLEVTRVCSMRACSHLWMRLDFLAQKSHDNCSWSCGYPWKAASESCRTGFAVPPDRPSARPRMSRDHARVERLRRRREKGHGVQHAFQRLTSSQTAKYPSWVVAS